MVFLIRKSQENHKKHIGKSGRQIIGKSDEHHGQNMKIIGKPKENHKKTEGKPYGNHRKTIGKPAESQRKTIRKKNLRETSGDVPIIFS